MNESGTRPKIYNVAVKLSILNTVLVVSTLYLSSPNLTRLYAFKKIRVKLLQISISDVIANLALNVGDDGQIKLHELD